VHRKPGEKDSAWAGCREGLRQALTGRPASGSVRGLIGAGGERACVSVCWWWAWCWSTGLAGMRPRSLAGRPVAFAQARMPPLR
jgi:hypothetical protein